MKAFILAVVAAFVIAGAASFVVDAFQLGSDVANTTSGARVDFAKDGVNSTLPH